MRRRILVLVALSAALAAGAGSIDRGLVEDGTDANAAEGATDSGTTLVKNNGTTRLRPATCAASSCTRVAPDAGTEGMSLEEITSWRVMVCAPGDQTLTGSGQLEFWTRDPVIGRWGPMKAKHLSVTETVAQCQSFPVEANDMAGAGLRGLYRPNAVAVSGNDGGSAITSLQACRPSTGQLPHRGPGCGP